MSRIYILILTLLISFSVKGVTLKSKLAALDVKVSSKTLESIEIGLNKCSIESNLILAIIMQESTFKVGAYNKRSKDYGLMQINEWHIERSKLDKDRLLSDVTYNIEIGCNIYKWFYKTYPLNESIGRYNAGTCKNCIKYKSVRRYILNVLKYKHKLDKLEYKK